MNETLYNLAAATGDARWIGVGDRFRKDAFFTPLAARLDELRGLHMNTHIPQVIGALRRHELTGEARDREIAIARTPGALPLARGRACARTTPPPRGRSLGRGRRFRARLRGSSFPTCMAQQLSHGPTHLLLDAFDRKAGALGNLRVGEAIKAMRHENFPSLWLHAAHSSLNPRETIPGFQPVDPVRVRNGVVKGNMMCLRAPACSLGAVAQQVRGELDSYSIRKQVLRGDGAKAYFDIYSSSVRDSAGRFRYGVRIIQDVTEAKRMEDRLRESERHMRNLLEAMPAAVYTTDAEGRITFFNKAAIQMAGRTPQIGEKWCVTWRLYRTDGTFLPHDECPMAVTLRENRPIRGEEAIAERPDGTRIPFVPYPTPLHDSDGKLIGAINMLIDITERKKAESRQKILIDELNHRVKNTLTTVQSLAGQTARGAENIQDFVRRFEIRLLALARAHDLLTRQHWENAPLALLVREVLAPATGETARRMRIEGPAVELHPRVALNLTMALNELVTNAVKYGSLSSAAGTLSLAWRLRQEAGRPVIDFEWQERGGPSVTPPTRRGFGTRLMERCIERDLAGEFDLVFDPEGVSCRMIFPLEEPAAA